VALARNLKGKKGKKKDGRTCPLYPAEKELRIKKVPAMSRVIPRDQNQTTRL